MRSQLLLGASTISLHPCYFWRHLRETRRTTKNRDFQSKWRLQTSTSCQLASTARCQGATDSTFSPPSAVTARSSPARSTPHRAPMPVLTSRAKTFVRHLFSSGSLRSELSPSARSAANSSRRLFPASHSTTRWSVTSSQDAKISLLRLPSHRASAHARAARLVMPSPSHAHTAAASFVLGTGCHKTTAVLLSSGGSRLSACLGGLIIHAATAL